MVRFILIQKMLRPKILNTKRSKTKCGSQHTEVKLQCQDQALNVIPQAQEIILQFFHFQTNQKQTPVRNLEAYKLFFRMADPEPIWQSYNPTFIATCNCEKQMCYDLQPQAIRSVNLLRIVRIYQRLPKSSSFLKPFCCLNSSIAATEAFS